MTVKRVDNKGFKPCILLISYVSERDDERAKACADLIKRLDELFDLPILAAIRGWEGRDLPDSPNVTWYRFDEPGISVARRFLRSVALASEYNYFIMFDDDTTFHGDAEGVRRYMANLMAHPDGYTVSGIPMMLKGFAISRSVFELVDYAPFTNRVANYPGRWLGFEDAAFVGECLVRFPEKGFWSYGIYNWTDVEHFSAKSTWLDEEAGKWIPLQYHNTRQYLLNISPEASYYFGMLRLTAVVGFKCDERLIYPASPKPKAEEGADE